MGKPRMGFDPVEELCRLTDPKINPGRIAVDCGAKNEGPFLELLRLNPEIPLFKRGAVAGRVVLAADRACGQKEDRGYGPEDL